MSASVPEPREGEPEQLTGEQREHALAMATAALWQARCHDWAAASLTVQALQDRYGGLGVWMLMHALADTVIARQHGPCPGKTVLPVWLDTTHQLVGQADDVTPRARWAGRFIAARASADTATIAALVDSCATGADFTDCVSGLMEVAVDTLNELDGVH